MGPVPLGADLHIVAVQVARRRGVAQTVVEEAAEGMVPHRVDRGIGRVLASEPVDALLLIGRGVAYEAHVEPAAHLALSLKNPSAEVLQAHAQVARPDEADGQANQLGDLLRQLGLAAGAQPVAEEQGRAVDLGREGHRAIEPRVHVDPLAGLSEVLGRGGHGRQHAQVVEVLAGQGLDPVPDGREHRDARELDAALAQKAHEDGVTHGAIGLAQQVEGRGPAAVFLQPGRDRAAEGVGVAVGAEDRLGVDARCDRRVARAGRVEEDQVGVLEQGVGIVPGRRVGAHMVHAVGLHAQGAEAAEVDGHRGAAGTAVEKDGHGPVGVGRAVRAERRIGNVEHLAKEFARVVAHVHMARLCPIGDACGLGAVGTLPHEGGRRFFRHLEPCARRHGPEIPGRPVGACTLGRRHGRSGRADYLRLRLVVHITSR